MQERRERREENQWNAPLPSQAPRSRTIGFADSGANSEPGRGTDTVTESNLPVSGSVLSKNDVPVEADIEKTLSRSAVTSEVHIAGEREKEEDIGESKDVMKAEAMHAEYVARDAEVTNASRSPNVISKPPPTYSPDAASRV